MVTHRADGKYYIGQTRYPLWYRWSLHKSDAKTRPACHFHKAIRKHGPDAFDIEIVAETDSYDELNRLEHLWIWALNATDPSVGYNHSTGGAAPVPSVETRRKMSEAAKRRVFTEEQRRKISEAGKGRKFTEEHRRKLSEANKGTKPSENTRLAVAEANRTRIHSEETRKKLSAAGKLSAASRRPPTVYSAETRAKLRAAAYRANEVRWGHRRLAQ